MIIKHLTYKSSPGIVSIEVKSETKSTITLESLGSTADITFNKKSKHATYWDTWKEAKNYLIARTEAKISALQEELAQIKQLEKPA